MPDKIIIEVNEDGLIKMDTDGISSVNHANAENFLRIVCRLAGGKISRFMRGKTGQVQTHQHTEQKG